MAGEFLQLGRGGGAGRGERGDAGVELFELVADRRGLEAGLAVSVGGGGLAGGKLLEACFRRGDAAFEFFAIALRVDGGPFHLLDLLAEGAEFAPP